MKRYVKNKYKNSNLYGLEKNENIFKAVNGIINISLGTLSTIDKMKSSYYNIYGWRLNIF
ncbi:hypothetical protein SAMN02745196_02558 [Clostridium collagenovorans DSM 3089]|uniref:Uncharacterized protein n=1 Tax=Clostridium collagenovorans DSM 3089 TaxID=1121306 RepID=A0A1M5XZ63_9CLOT|nr:hypothetical protein [Clostridium collagenovorans]SHI05105.1 hypothetical protein SAMN02745196_02558 [Clostridium collagenovorans DSM 3089]